jgi:ELWxxDGT repeat protein
VLPSLAPYLLKEINSTSLGSSPTDFVQVGTKTFFSANDSLWYTDGTARGTVNIPGASHPTYLTNLNGTLFFSALAGSDGALWRSDGTISGTTVVQDLPNVLLKSSNAPYPGPGYYNYFFAPAYPRELTNVNGVLFFVPAATVGGDPVEPPALWESNGATDGTARVATSVVPGLTDVNIPGLTDVNGTLFFADSNGELWATTPTSAPQDLHSEGHSLTNVNGRLFFSSFSAVVESNGTAAGTSVVGSVSESGGPYLNNLVNVNGTLFFYVDIFESSRQLWESSVSTGTVELKEFPSKGINDYASLFESQAAVAGTLFFSANDGTHGNELWQSNGTVAGTFMVQDVDAGSPTTDPKDLVNVNGTLFFAARDGTHGFQLWDYNGSAQGTALVKDIYPTNGYYTGRYGGPSYVSPTTLTNIQGTLLFSADDGTHGAELWRSNGSAAGTLMVADLNITHPGSQPSHFMNVNGTIFFSADDGMHGTQVWRTNGTAGGTFMLADVDPGSGKSGSKPMDLTNYNGTLFFDAQDGSSFGLWESNGTASGATLVQDLFAGTGYYFVQNLFFTGWTYARYTGIENVNGTLFFTAAREGMSYPNTPPQELFESNGIAAGAQALGAAPTGKLANVNGTLFFNSDGSLARLDGLDGQTGFLGPAAANLADVADINGTLFFSTVNGQHGGELWASNGTASGTVAVTDINNAGSANAQYLTNVNGTLFFSANDGTHGDELWESNGAAAGTFLVKDINVGTRSSYPSYLTNLNGTLFFAASDGTPGAELWESNGSATGTFLVDDVAPGSKDFAYHLTNVNGRLFFAVGDGTHGAQLWQSNGSQAGTVMRSEFSAPGLSSLTNINGTLFFSAADAFGGSQPWVLSPADGPSVRVTTSANPSVFGQAITITATVSGGSGPTTGRVDFTDGAIDLTPGNVALEGAGPAMATFTTSSLPVGTHTITATYFGDALIGGSGDDSAAPLVIGKATTITSNVTSPGNSVYHQTITFSATVSVKPPGGGTLTGIVNFLDGAQTLGSASLETGVATFSDAALAVGAHTITAEYGGDANFTASNDQTSSTRLVQTVSRDVTKTTVTSTLANPLFFGADAITYTATVSVNAPGLGTPGGSIEWSIDGGNPTTTALSGGATTFSISGLNAGKHTVTAAYGGNDPSGDFMASHGSQVRTVNLAATQIALTAPSPATTPYGTRWSATATLSVPSGRGAGTPTGGSVIFTATFISNANSTGQFLLGGKTTIAIGSACREPWRQGGAEQFLAGWRRAAGGRHRLYQRGKGGRPQPGHLRDQGRVHGKCQLRCQSFLLGAGGDDLQGKHGRQHRRRHPHAGAGGARSDPDGHSPESWGRCSRTARDGNLQGQLHGGRRHDQQDPGHSDAPGHAEGRDGSDRDVHDFVSGAGSALIDCGVQRRHGSAIPVTDQVSLSGPVAPEHVGRIRTGGETGPDRRFADNQRCG